MIQIRHFSKDRLKASAAHAAAKKGTTPVRPSYTGPTLSIAFTFVRNEDGSITADYGIAQCNRSMDNFSTVVGRELATKRLEKASVPRKGDRALNSSGRLPPDFRGTLHIADGTGVDVGVAIRDHYLAQRERALAPWTMSEVLASSLYNSNMFQ